MTVNSHRAPMASVAEPSALDAQVRSAMHGDRTAFAALYHSRASAVRATMRCLVGPPEVSQDLVTTAFVRAWRELPNLPDSMSFDVWLYDIADAVAKVATTTPQPAILSASGPAEAEADALARHVRWLGARQREVLLLRTLFRVPAQDLARALRTTVEEVHASERDALEELAAAR